MAESHIKNPSLESMLPDDKYIKGYSFKTPSQLKEHKTISSKLFYDYTKYFNMDLAFIIPKKFLDYDSLKTCLLSNKVPLTEIEDMAWHNGKRYTGNSEYLGNYNLTMIYRDFTERTTLSLKMNNEFTVPAIDLQALENTGEITPIHIKKSPIAMIEGSLPESVMEYERNIISSMSDMVKALSDYIKVYETYMGSKSKK